ncbi:hypothetical protein EPUS_04958 [Endocarpon pusillum Z07020]|uniref:AAA+ ATPase domain-containing protein n=1 Tax=Endocarpon pusillum (strain Z07020 / HMAS-L-300199) TaxID=1263415 RepID=U1HNT6_ENDPU|nr:uncharacterized protein EPUS_04958 [Endocarpon pusillum Z07020]ERF72040.1 hypothetical protein EPUS_04958 [Endocarpon pusillum Z07020]
MAAASEESSSSSQEAMLPTPSSSQSSINQRDRSKTVAIEYVQMHEDPNPHLEVRCIVRNALTGEDIRHAVAEFWLEGNDMLDAPRRVLRVRLVDDNTGQTLKDETDQVEGTSLRFSYTAAVVSGVDEIPEEWPVEVKDSVACLAIYRKDGLATISPAKLIGGSPRAVFKYLKNNTPGNLWKPYMNERPQVTWENLDKLYSEEGPLAISCPVQQCAARCHFSSPEEAQSKLVVARYNDQKWEEKMFLELCKGKFNAAFFFLGPRTAIACLRRKDPGVAIDPNAVWDERMNVVIKFEVEVEDIWGDPDDSDVTDETETTVRLVGNVVSNQTPVNCEIVVLLQWIPWELYKFIRPLTEPPNFIDLSDVQIEVNDQPARNQVKSLNTFFDRKEGKFEKWWPMLLAQGASRAPRVNFLSKIGWTKQHFELVQDKITKRMLAAGKPLNLEQRNILADAPYSRAGFKVIVGPPGCDKTTLIAMLAGLYAQDSKVGVLVAASSNGSTDRLFETVNDWERNDPRADTSPLPLHVHKKQDEFNYFWSVLNPAESTARKQTQDDRSSLILKEADDSPRRFSYERQQDAEKRKHLSDVNSGVGAMVLKAVQDGELPAVRASGNPASKRMHDAHRARAASSLSVLMRYRIQLKNDTSKHLRPADNFAIRKAFEAVARYMIGTKRLIVSTVGNATSTILKDCIFRDAKHVVLIMDEAGLATDADLIHLIVSLITPERIEAEFGGENPILTVVLVGDERQGCPLIKSDIAKANVFGPQLSMSPFLRCALSGFPMAHLWEQHRMVPVICKLPSTRGYEGKLRTSDEAMCRRMSIPQRTILMDLLEFDSLKLKYPPNEDPIRAQDQHLRYWLLDVRHGSTQTDIAMNKSKFNVANVDVTMKFLKALIQSEFLPPEIRITFYRAQCQRYIAAIAALEAELGMREGQLHGLVHTSDSFQGQEATCIILDLVVTRYYGENTMGHAGNEKKANVAFTRARDFLFVVGDSTILDSPYLGDKHGMVEFIFAVMVDLLTRQAVKVCYSDKTPEPELVDRFNKLSTEDDGANFVETKEVD